jgi:UDP-glucose 4-epimerase
MWLVTGGAGYIGSHVVRALLADGQRVCVVDDLSSGIADRVPANVQLEVFNVLDTSSLAHVLADLHVDGVIHLAARKAAGESVEQPLFYHRENSAGMLSLLEAMDAAGVHKLVYSSSAAVYGEPVDTDPLRETSPTAPTNPYGTSKLIGEMMIRDAAGPMALSWAALRYFNVAGAGAPELSDTSANNLIPLLLRAWKAQRPAKIFGADYPTPDGTCIRDYIHVVDLAEAHVAACRLLTEAAAKGDRVGVALNIGTGTGSSVREVIDSMSKSLGATLPAEESQRRQGDPSIVQADPGQALQLLGWKSRHTLDDMTASAVAGLDWLSENGYV